MVEAHLNPELPSEAGQQHGDSLLERGVSLIEETVELFAMPPKGELDRRLERTHDPVDGADRQPRQLPALESRHDITRERRPSAELLLGPAAPQP